MGGEKRYSPNRRLIFFICWITYIMAYLCRVNFSSALGKLETALSVNSSSLGIIGSLFFITYACGQLINGYIGDKISPYKFITLAIFGTALLNILITFTDNFFLIMILWGANGYFQSMLWGPLMRLLSMHFDKKYNVNISTGMSTSMVMGFSISWSVFGRAFMNYSWQYYFIIPAIGSLILGLLWVKLSSNDSGTTILEKKQDLNIKELLNTIAKEKLWIIALICLCQGLIKESLSLWAPILLIRVFNIELKSSFAFILIVPAANFIGILYSRKMIKKYENHIKTALLIMFGIAIGCSLVLLLLNGASAIVSVILIAAISGMMYGSNNILLSYIPLTFAHKNIVSTLVGIFDFSSYAGAAISSVILGIMLADSNYNLIFIIWAAVAAIATILSILYGLTRRSETKHCSV